MPAVGKRTCMYGLAALGAAGAAAGAYARWIEPNWLAVNEVDVTVPDLAEAWQGACIAHLSDFQVGLAGANLGVVRKAIARAVEAQPDIIALTGDFLYNGRGHAHLPGLFAPLSPSQHVFAVLGNHDYGRKKSPDHDRPAEELASLLRDLGIRVLRNEAAPIVRHGDQQWIVGLDDVNRKKVDLQRALAQVPAGRRPLVVLVHEPDFIERMPANTAALVLSGHTHGGQVGLPGREPFSWLNFVGGELRSDYVEGLYEVNGIRLYVNHGIGMSKFPVRFGTRPELTLLTLQRG